jgi:hypothetical protein
LAETPAFDVIKRNAFHVRLYIRWKPMPIPPLATHHKQIRSAMCGESERPLEPAASHQEISFISELMSAICDWSMHDSLTNDPEFDKDSDVEGSLFGSQDRFVRFRLCFWWKRCKLVDKTILQQWKGSTFLHPETCVAIA